MEIVVKNKAMRQRNIKCMRSHYQFVVNCAVNSCPKQIGAESLKGLQSATIYLYCCFTFKSCTYTQFYF